jgi:hypothetical protein
MASGPWTSLAAATSVRRVLLEDTDVVDPALLAQRTGWELKPEGLCKADRCVPLGGRPLTAAVLAERLGMALVGDAEHGLAALGPESGGRALLDARMPDLELPDRHGRPFSLRSLRGTRIVMVAWASW